MKILIGLAIVCFTTYCGRFCARKYRLRKHFFGQFYEFNERFLNEIAYYRRPLMEFAVKYPYKGEFQKLIEGFFGTLRQKTTKDTGVHGLLDEYDFLKADEKVFAGDYLTMIGKGDSGSQKEYFSGVRKQLSDYKEESAKECERYGNLYLKLGFLLGLAVLVLIV